jgi:hypothetical protein
VKHLPVLASMSLFAVLLALLSAPHLLKAQDPSPLPNFPISQSPTSPAYQLLTNPGVEFYDPPYAQFEGVNCQVATGWQRFWDAALPEPCWMDCRVFAASHLGSGWVDRIEGETSHLLVSTQPYTAGIRQTVTGLTPGAGYGFHAAMLTIYQTSAPPAVHGTMIKQVGMDPSGGIDPDGPDVIWCDPDDHDEGPWSVDLRTAAFAESPTMTVFIRVISPRESGGLPYINLGFLDSAILALTPVVTATSPAVSEVPTFTVSWDNLVTAPGLKKFKGYDVQWLDESEGVWHGWITRTIELVEAPFVGQRGHVYRFRARAWQKYQNGALLSSPYRPTGDSRTLVLGPKLAGQVLSNEGMPLAGATVAISATTYATVSGSGGRYALDLPAWSEPQAITVSHANWLAPPPVYGVTFGPTETVPITWTLRPPGDAVTNGGFESGLEGWLVTTSEAVTEEIHTGHYALAMASALATSGTGAVSQTMVFTDAWEPALSFWYRSATTDTDDLTLNVVLTVVTQTISTTLPITPLIRTAFPLTGPITSTLMVTSTYLFTPSLAAGGWQHQWYRVGPAEAYLTATVTVQFQAWHADDDGTGAVYVDEVSLGPTPGGPHKAYLPLVLRP